ncbi:MAG: TatD family hydrolase [Desulfofustis sp.]|nr:TatD family hydrolase [Desulfofustis sp.]
MELIDTHCHLDVAEFADDYHQVRQRAAAVGVSELIVPAVDRACWPRLLELCRLESGCHPALGLHPLYLQHHRTEDLTELSRQIDAGAAVAVGEIGLDFWDRPIESVRRRQFELFEAQLRVAKAAALPVLLHARKAHDQVLAVLRRLRFSHGGIVHAFSGSRQQAGCYVDLGFVIGVGGTITYQRANRVRAVVADLPLTALVLETDAPDIPTAAHRKERNSPEYLPEILFCLAELRSQDPALVAETTSCNARTLLRLT